MVSRNDSSHSKKLSAIGLDFSRLDVEPDFRRVALDL